MSFLYLKVHALTALEEHWFIYILGVLIDSSQEVCFSQDTSCSQENISSAQQPSGYSEVVSTSQETSSETDTSTSKAPPVLGSQIFTKSLICHSRVPLAHL